VFDQQMWVQKHVQIIYVMYFAVLGTALAAEIEYPGNQMSPGLTLSVLTLHFMLGIVESRESPTWWKRYFTCGALWWRSTLAIATDSLLVAALVLASMWMYATDHDIETRELAINSLVCATVGNLGCVVLRFTSKKYTLLETEKK
jgi:hypothetical protein